MSKKKATKPWLGWSLGERRRTHFTFDEHKKSRRFQKSLKRRMWVQEFSESEPVMLVPSHLMHMEEKRVTSNV